MKRQAALLPISSAPGSPAPQNKRSLRTVINPDCSGLTFSRMSLALLIIGLFWMVVQLYEYVIWLRGGEKGLLLVAVIASCIAIHINDRIGKNLEHKRENSRKCIGYSSYLW
jgi:hypothetical protein